MKRLLVLLFAGVLGAVAQNAFRVDPSSVTTTNGSTPPGAYAPIYAVPGSTIKVFTNAGATLLATTYTDGTAALTCPTTAQVVLAGTSLCVSTSDQLGNFGFWISPGQYWYTVTFPNGATYGPLPITTSTSNLGTYTAPFTGAVTRSVASKFADVVSVKDFGAVGNDIADDSTAIQAAITAGCTGLQTRSIYFPAATYLISSGITIPQRGCDLVGDGENNSILDFEPSAPGVAVTFSAGAAVLYQCSIREMTISSSDTAFAKTALLVSDISSFTLYNVSISGPLVDGTRRWYDASGTSVGVQVKGREASTFRSLFSSANIPLQLSKNPNTTSAQLEDLDHMRFADLYLIAYHNPNILADDGVYFSETTFDGRQAWVQGTYGFYRNNTIGASASAALTIKNYRWEQSESVTGWQIYLNSTAGTIRGLYLENTNGALTGALAPGGAGQNTNGIYLRKIVGGHLTGGIYTGGAVGLDRDNTVSDFNDADLNFALGGTRNVPTAYSPDFKTIDGSYDTTSSAFQRYARSIVVYDGSTNTGTALNADINTFGQVTLAAPATVASFFVYLKQTGAITNTTGTLQGVIRADSAGLPGSVVASWTFSPFGLLTTSFLSTTYVTNSPVLLSAGTYWFGVHESGAPAGGTIQVDTLSTGSGLIATSPDGTAWTLQPGTLRLFINSQSARAGYFFSDNSSGIYGQSTNQPGVTGLSLYGLGGLFNSTYNIALSAVSANNVAVLGTTTTTDAIYGQSTSANGVKGTSLSGRAGYFVQVGTLTATTTFPTVQVTRQTGLGGFDNTGAVLRVDDVSGSSGNVLEAYYGGSYRLRVAPSGITQVSVGIQPGAMTVGAGATQLPACSSTIVGTISRVTDSLTPAIGSTVVGGGAAFALVVCNGTNWTVTGK